MLLRQRKEPLPSMTPYTRAHLLLGYVYLNQKRYDQALAEVERGIALDPNKAESYAALAESVELYR